MSCWLACVLSFVAGGFLSVLGFIVYVGNHNEDRY